MEYNNVLFLVSVVFFFMIMSFKFSEAAQMVPAMFVFGDSLVDVGNNNYLELSLEKAALPHYGIDFPTKQPNGRFTNGFNAADFLAEKVGLPTPPPYLSLLAESNNNYVYGTSFASGGARILDGTDPYPFQSVHLTEQVDYFSRVYEELHRELGSSGTQKLLSKSIFTNVIGNNDILSYFSSSDLRTNFTPQQYVDFVALTLKGKLKQLYNYGARKFVITGVPIVGCLPLRRRELKNKQCDEERNHFTVKYNEGLTLMLQELKSNLKDIHYSYTDSYSVVLDFIRNLQHT